MNLIVKCYQFFFSFNNACISWLNCIKWNTLAKWDRVRHGCTVAFLTVLFSFPSDILILVLVIFSFSNSDFKKHRICMVNDFIIRWSSNSLPTKRLGSVRFLFINTSLGRNKLIKSDSKDYSILSKCSYFEFSVH